MSRRTMPIDPNDSRFASFFDELPLWSAPFGAMVLDAVDMGPAMRVLDVGAGTGFLTLELAQRLGGESHVDALDVWGAALDRLRCKIEFLGLANVACHECDAVSLPFEDGTFDAIVSNVGINNFAEPDRVAAECFRVSKPGAQLVLSTNLQGHMQELYDVYDATLVELGLAEERHRLRVHVEHRATRESVVALVEGAGFQLESWTETSFRMRFRDGAAVLAHFLIRIGFLEAWREVVREERADPVMERLAANLGSNVVLTIPAACATARRPA